jgi:hypothetical protein
LLLRGKAANVVLARACPWINSSASGVARKSQPSAIDCLRSCYTFGPTSARPRQS